MISKELFKEILLHVRRNEEYVDNICNAVKLDIWDTPLYENYGWMLDRLIESYFDEEGTDHINWFMFEHHDMVSDFDDKLNLLHPGRLSMSVDGKNIPMDSVDDCWEYVKEYRK